MVIDPAPEEQVPRDEDERAGAEHEPGLPGRKPIRLDEERSDEHQRSGPGRIGEELARRPSDHSWLGEHGAKVRSRRCRRRGRSASQDRQRDEREGERRREPGESPAGFADEPGQRHPDDPRDRGAEKRDGEHAGSIGGRCPVRNRRDRSRVGEPDSDADPDLRQRDHDEVRRRRAERRRGNEAEEPGTEQLPQADPRREQAGEERGQPGRQPRHRPQLSGGRGRDLEIGCERGQHRSQDEDRGLRSCQAQEERRGNRAPRVGAHQMMIGTVPPSALQAAPVTYDARSEQRKTMTEAISSGRASRPSGRPAPTFARTSSRSPC